MMRDEKLKDLFYDVVDYLSAKSLMDDAVIYFDGHKYTNYPETEEAEALTTLNGTKYFDQHVSAEIANPKRYTEYCDPESITITFEGPLYDSMNYGGEAEDDLTDIARKYNYYPEQGDSWNLCFYEDMPSSGGFDDADEPQTVPFEITWDDLTGEALRRLLHTTGVRNADAMRRKTLVLATIEVPVED